MSSLKVQIVSLMTLLLVLSVGPLNSVGQASLVTSIASDQGGAETYQLGQVVQFSVMLSGLSDQQSLEGLSVVVTTDALLLESPQQVVSGAIVPVPEEFFFSAGLNEVDGNFQSLGQGGTSIDQDGVFYQFQATTKALGSGVIDFSFLDAQETGTLNSVPIQGTTFNFEVVPVPVPEPSSLILLAIGLILFLCFGITVKKDRKLLGLKA